MHLSRPVLTLVHNRQCISARINQEPGSACFRKYLCVNAALHVIMRTCDPCTLTCTFTCHRKYISEIQRFPCQSCVSLHLVIALINAEAEFLFLSSVVLLNKPQEFNLSSFPLLAFPLLTVSIKFSSSVERFLIYSWARIYVYHNSMKSRMSAALDGFHEFAAA